MICQDSGSVLNGGRFWKLVLSCCFVFQLSAIVDAQQQQNSMRKIRVKPNAMSQRIGSAIQWADNWEDARAKSKSTGKPIFWYVPTLRGTFMDRKKEIDRYMMSGPFSWPANIRQINSQFVPFKAEPTQEQQEKFKLLRYQFVEPGFLIIREGKEVGRIDQISTFQYDWWRTVLNRFSNKDFKNEAWLTDLLKAFESDPNSISVPDNANFDEQFAHKLMLKGMHQFDRGNHKSADQTWQTLVDKMPEHPLAWKAAAEIQRIGPYSRGFEVLTPLPEKNLMAGVESRGTRSVSNVFSRSQLWTQGTDFLLRMQNQSGGFLDSDYDFGGTDSLPNVHVAVTALAGMALIKARSRAPADKQASIDQSIERCVQFVTNESNINRIDRDEILWADAYRLRFLCRYAELKKGDIDDEIVSATKALENLQSKRGGWYHEYENAFVTATALCALFDANKAGISVDESKISKGVKSLAAERYDNGTYPYSTRRRGRAPADLSKMIPGSAGRMPICELALNRWGQADQKALENAIETSFEYHKNLDVALKYDNHTSTYAYGGFFFWYDMRSRCEAIMAIEDPVLRNKFLMQQLELVMALPEFDGCFIDSHELGRCYGTAMALLCLADIETAITQ